MGSHPFIRTAGRLDWICIVVPILVRRKFTSKSGPGRRPLDGRDTYSIAAKAGNPTSPRCGSTDDLYLRECKASGEVNPENKTRYLGWLDAYFGGNATRWPIPSDRDVIVPVRASGDHEGKPNGKRGKRIHLSPGAQFRVEVGLQAGNDSRAIASRSAAGRLGRYFGEIDRMASFGFRSGSSKALTSTGRQKSPDWPRAFSLPKYL